MEARHARGGTSEPSGHDAMEMAAHHYDDGMICGKQLYNKNTYHRDISRNLNLLLGFEEND